MNRQAQAFARPLLALMVAVSLASGVEAQTQIKSGWNTFSPEQDVEIGRQSAAQAEQQLPIVRDQAINDYVNNIGQKLARNAGGPNFPYTFRVVNQSDINAFALPGGPIYLNRGIIENAQNEGEVAGVLAHEIAHVALRHGTQNATKAQGAQAGLSVLGAILGGRVGQNAAQVINVAGGLGLNALFLKFSREFETQADVRGAQILAASGYAPADMISFFKQLEKVDRSKKTTWLSHHPAPPDRQARITKEAQLLRVSSSPTTNVQQLASVKSRLRGLGAAPTSAQVAQSANNRQRQPQSGNSGNSPSIGRVAAPSTSLRTFTDKSGVFQISYPSNWKVYDNEGFGVTMAPEGGVGRVGDRTEVVYGAIVAHHNPHSQSLGNSLREGTSAGTSNATQDLLNDIQRESPHLRMVSGSEQNFNLDGRNAVAVSLRGNNPNTRIEERVTLVSRSLADGHLMYMLFVTPEREAQSYSPLLEAMVRSINIDDNRRH